MLAAVIIALEAGAQVGPDPGDNQTETGSGSGGEPGSTPPDGDAGDGQDGTDGGSGEPEPSPPGDETPSSDQGSARPDTASEETRGSTQTEADPAGEVVSCLVSSRLALKTGDIVVDGTVGIEVPSPGKAAHAASVGEEEGYSDVLYVEHVVTGVVKVAECGPDAVVDPLVPPDLEDPGPDPSDPAIERTAPASTQSKPPCEDNAYNLSDRNFRWTQTYKWSFNRSTHPSEISADNAENAMKRGTDTITTERDSCGLPDQVSATHTYEGNTAKRAEMHADFSDPDKPRLICETTQLDGVSVSDFGGLIPGALANTCTHFRVENNANIPTESDMRLNSSNYNWAEDATGASCNNKRAVSGVTAHERGHTFGLDHVPEQTHGNLTMSALSNGPCQNSEYTLGRGDVLGLRSLY